MVRADTDQQRIINLINFTVLKSQSFSVSLCRVGHSRGRDTALPTVFEKIGISDMVRSFHIYIIINY